MGAHAGTEPAETPAPPDEPVDQDVVGALAWHSLAIGYLAIDQPRIARQAALELIRIRRRVPEGYALVGDAYAAQDDWENAYRYYLEARQRAQAGDPEIQVRLDRASAELRHLAPEDRKRSSPIHGTDLRGHFSGQKDKRDTQSRLPG